LARVFTGRGETRSADPDHHHQRWRARLIAAIEQVWPNSLRIRCWAHKARNVLDKVPEAARGEVKAHWAQIREAATLADGQQAVQRFRQAFEKLYPSATKSLLDDCEASRNPLRIPPAHRKVRPHDKSLGTHL